MWMNVSTYFKKESYIILSLFGSTADILEILELNKYFLFKDIITICILG